MIHITREGGEGGDYEKGTRRELKLLIWLSGRESRATGTEVEVMQPILECIVIMLVFMLPFKIPMMIYVI